MTPTSLILVADRGSLKAYKVNQTPNRGASLQLTQAFDITDAHGRYDDKVTDEAGRFPVSDGSAARHANSIAERTALETETDRRICKQLAEQIEEVVKRDRRRRLVVCRAGFDSCRCCRFAAERDPRPHRRACEVGSGEDRAGEIARNIFVRCSRFKLRYCFLLSLNSRRGRTMSN